MKGMRQEHESQFISPKSKLFKLRTVKGGFHTSHDHSNFINPITLAHGAN